jgi:8-oxo-dGTP pyrophosphatase MutT (NUDIX family)
VTRGPGGIERHLRERLASRTPRRVFEADLRPAAVLIPIISEPEGDRLLLTRRASTLRRQPNEISFPGGAVDASDPSALAAALRESEEEVGLKRSDVEILGQLDELVTVTGFVITPFVGLVHGPYAFRANHEVAELILVPLATLRRPGAVRVEMRALRPGVLIPIFHYQHGVHDIWGITGRLVKELLAFLPEESAS